MLAADGMTNNRTAVRALRAYMLKRLVGTGGSDASADLRAVAADAGTATDAVPSAAPKEK